MFVLRVFVFLSLILSTTPSLALTWRASWYQQGHITASGAPFNPNHYTAAHKTLPFGTKVLVTYNGRSVTVLINDRGPFVHGRDVDLTRAAAQTIHCPGVCTVTVKILGK